MKKFLSDMNPTLRGFLLIAVVAAVIVALSLEESVLAISMLLRIAFFLAIAFFVYLLWRERRSDIATWPTRAQWVFYGAAGVILADLAAFFGRGLEGRDALAFVLVLVLCGYSMFRTWRDQHTYA